MAKLKVEVKSKEMIKPCSPTPNHLKNLQLSFIDQFTPPVHMPLIFFFNGPVNETAEYLLKSSLAATLVQFYPLAGRIEGNSSISCNDQGVVYCVAYVSSCIAEVVEDPNPEELLRLLAVQPVSDDKSLVAGVRVNHFQCGGIAISVSVSHKIADLATAVAFVNAWATNTSTVSDISNVSQLKFDGASIFLPINLDGLFDHEKMISQDKVVTRRLIFDRDMIDRLREQVNASSHSRADLVLGFLWKWFLDIAKAKATTVPKISIASQIVSMRTITTSTIPEDCYGNLYWVAIADTSSETELKYPDAVAMLTTAVQQMKKGQIPDMRAAEASLEFLKNKDGILNRQVNICTFSSCTRFPLYEVNFGWGTPIWVSSATLPLPNSVFLLSTKCGQGIEAWCTSLNKTLSRSYKIITSQPTIFDPNSKFEGMLN